MRAVASLIPLAVVELVATCAGFFGRFIKPSWEAGLAGRIRGIYWGWYFGARRLHVGRHVIIEGRARMKIGSDVRLQAGVQLIAAGEGRLEIGNRTSISRLAMISAANPVRIGSNCDISSHVSVFSITSDGRALVPFDRRKKAPVTVEDGVLIGTGVRLLPGVTIGCNATIGAGAVVTGDIPARAIAVGIPARVIATKDAAGGRAGG